MNASILLRIFLFFLLVPFSFPKATAQDAPSKNLDEKIDSFLRLEMERLRIPGLSLVVLRDGKIISRSDLGYSNLELGSRVTENTAFSIASMSKTYTAAAVHLLAERGKLDLNDSVRKYLPDAPQAWQAITLQQLISHTSGLVDDWALYDDWDDTPSTIFARAADNEEILQTLYRSPLLFTPGTRAKYGSGAFVLGLVIEKVTGKSYSRFMREEVLEPMGLKQTWVDDPRSVIPNRANGYIYKNNILRNGHALSAATLARGDVGIRASASDVAKWFAGLRGGGVLKRGDRLFQPASLNNGAPVPRSLGGWFIWYERGTRTIDHSGNYRSGFSSIMIEFVEDDLTIVLLTNRADTPTFSIALQVASLFNPEYRPIKELRFKKKATVASAGDLLKVIRSINSGTPDPSVMDEKFPMSFYEYSSDDFAGIDGVEVLGRRDVSAKKRLIFGKPLKELWFCRLNGKSTQYTAFYVGPNGKILFVDLPED